MQMTTLATTNRSWRLWRRFVGCVCAGVLALQIGCYSYLPVQTNVPTTGTRIAVVLNDRGRAQISEQLGSAMDKVDGLLVAAGESSVTLEVYRTTDLRGNEATWTGERVQLPKDGITGYQERQLSKRRTTLLVAGVVIGITAVMTMANLNIFSGFTHDTPSGGTTGESR